MTALTTRQLRWLHDELPSDVEDSDLQERFDDLGSVRDVAIAVLRDIRSELLKSPMSVSVSGVASVNYAENVKAIERRITALTQLDDDPSSDPGEEPVDGEGHMFRQTTLTRTRGR